MDQKTEADIVVRVLKGDRQAYALLIDEYKNPIYNLACRMTVYNLGKYRNIQLNRGKDESYIPCFRRK